ncbi:MAG: hypothetical protein O9306_14680, partial [Beijerinckiaceae bacterium]|nr:hypothetical protein [Beijerinckiaceae bacterium]
SGKRAGATTKMADLGTIKSPVHDHAGELLISKSATVELIEPSSLIYLIIYQYYKSFFRFAHPLIYREQNPGDAR